MRSIDRFIHQSVNRKQLTKGLSRAIGEQVGAAGGERLIEQKNAKASRVLDMSSAELRVVA